jgi:hypothetical protein
VQILLNLYRHLNLKHLQLHLPSVIHASLPIACVDWHGLQKVSVIANALDLNDDKGLIKSAPNWARDEHPGLAGLKDASYIVLSYSTPLNAIDNAIAGFFDPNTSTSEAVTNAAAITLATAVPEGGVGLGTKKVSVEPENNTGARFYGKGPKDMVDANNMKKGTIVNEGTSITIDSKSSTFNAKIDNGKNIVI